MAKPSYAAALILLCVAAVAGSSAAGGAATPSPRIVGGGKANAAGWQFAVALEQKRRLICTGSLIAPRGPPPGRAATSAPVASVPEAPGASTSRAG
jgi:secreted trypsin-like serine protease